MTWVTNVYITVLRIFSSQTLHLLLTSILGLIQNLALDAACWPYFKSTRFADILTIHTKMSDEGIRFMSLYTLSLLAEIIPIEKQGVLCFEENTIKEYIAILTTAVSSTSLEANKVFGSLVIPADDILRLLKQIWYIESNKNSIFSFLSSLMFPIEVCLQRGNKMQQIAAVDLLWTLSSESTSDIDLKLMKTVVESSCDVSTEVRVMTSCALYNIHPEMIKSGTY